VAVIQNIISQDLDVIPQGAGTVILRLKPTQKEVLDFVTPSQLEAALASLRSRESALIERVALLESQIRELTT